MKYFKLEREKETNSYTTVANINSSSYKDSKEKEEILKEFKTIAERNDVSIINLLSFPLLLEYVEHTNLVSHIATLILKDSCKQIIVSEKQFAIIRGKLKGILYQNVKESLGPTIKLAISEKLIKVQNILNFDFFLSKIQSTSVPENIVETVKVLNSIQSLKKIPFLYAAIIYAYKFVWKEKRKCGHEVFPSEPSTGNEEVNSRDKNPDQNSEIKYTPGSNSKKTKKCYVCKQPYSLPKRKCKYSAVFKQYPRMCMTCGELNLTKRDQKVDLKGKYAVVTGGRIKIGFELVLKMLRDGCFVILTTRFPNDASKRLKQQPDFTEWKSNVKIYPLDMKDMQGIFRFITYVKESVPHLDIIVNNAAQTLRRPIDFYRDLLDYECIPRNHLLCDQQELIATEEILNYGYFKQNIAKSVECDTTLIKKPKIEDVTDEAVEAKQIDVKNSSKDADVLITIKNEESVCIDESNSTTDSNTVVKPSQNTKQTEEYNVKPAGSFQRSLSDSFYAKPCSPLTPYKNNTKEPNPRYLEARSNAHNARKRTYKTSAITNSVATNLGFCLGHYFPRGAMDSDGQQLDLRRHNSWRSVLENVPVTELMEVLMINTVAPFIFNKELKSLLMKSPHSRKFIVNVSAMEGQFNRNAKTRFHPHTNMAKASLNMMTRTAALGYSNDGIYMTAVDTGWVTDERPLKMAKREQRIKGFRLPLDCIDGAARIYDPIVTGYKLEKKPFSAVFLKDYKVYPW